MSRWRTCCNTCRTAFAGGYSAVKLYFMLGLPTETDEDVLGIADVAARVHARLARERPEQAAGRPHHRVHQLVRAQAPHRLPVGAADHQGGVRAPCGSCCGDAIKTKTVTYNWHDSDTSFLEAVLARGDRRLGKVLETAWRKGAHLDAWEEYFSLDRWLEAFDACGLDPPFLRQPHPVRGRAAPLEHDLLRRDAGLSEA